MQTEQNSEHCKCSMEQRFARLGARMDHLMEQADDAQKHVQTRLEHAAEARDETLSKTRAVISNIKSSLKELRDEVTEIFTTLCEGTGEVGETLFSNRECANRSESKVPCVPHNNNHQTTCAGKCKTVDDSQDISSACL